MFGKYWMLAGAMLGLCLLGGPVWYSVARARAGRRPAPTASRLFSDADQIADRVVRRWQADLPA